MSDIPNLPTQSSPQCDKACPKEFEESFDMKDTSTADASIISTDFDQSGSSIMDIDSSSSSIVADDKKGPSRNDTLAPKKKRIKLSAESESIKAEKEKLKQERELIRAKKKQAKLEKERERIEREKEKIEIEKQKLKQKEELQALKEKKQQELNMKKLQLEKDKQEKIRQKEEERERKDREKKEKDDQKNRIREEKEKEKQRKQQEKLAQEEQKKQQDELEAKKLQKSRDVLFNFLKKSNSENKANTSITSQSSEIESTTSITPAHLLESFDLVKFDDVIEKQSEPQESLYLEQLLGGKIKSYIAPQNANDDCEIIEDLPDNLNNDKYIFLQFHENVRPPYFGKRLHDLALVTVKGRNPFKKEEFLDYEVDSDEEWDEGGPGESLSGSDSDHEEKDDYEIDDKFFVPHGYLSDDENKLEEVAEDPDPNAKCSGPLLKEQALMAERNRKFANHLFPQVIGCIWQEDKETFPEKFEFLQQFKAVCLSN